MSETVSGGCLCGAVRFSATIGSREMGVCHCGMCRRWAGGVFMGVETESLDVVDEASLGIFRSSDYGERGFCRSCGASLFWRMQDGSSAVVSVQALDDSTGFRFASEIFVDAKPAFYSFAEPTHKLTGAEFLASVGGSQ